MHNPRERSKQVSHHSFDRCLIEAFILVTHRSPLFFFLLTGDQFLSSSSLIQHEVRQRLYGARTGPQSIENADKIPFYRLSEPEKRCQRTSTPSVVATTRPGNNRRHGTKKNQSTLKSSTREKKISITKENEGRKTRAR